jgi:secreted effector protein SseD
MMSPNPISAGATPAGAAYASDAVSTDAPGASSVSYSADHGALGTINDLIVLMRKMDMQLRDVNRKFVETLAVVGYTQQMEMIKSKMDAIGDRYRASMTRGLTQIGAGLADIGGVASRSAGWSAGLQGAGKAGEGLGGVMAAGSDRSAQQTDVLAEAQDAAMKRTLEELSKLVQRAQQASSDMMQVTSQLTSLRGNLLSAVHI